ncbi:phage tail protein [Cereibacter changlensis]|uniref:phage tail protein n=1 Tax=Cereibacter changlensis TaxID=402884 RepID=UPI004033D378
MPFDDLPKLFDHPASVRAKLLCTTIFDDRDVIGHAGPVVGFVAAFLSVSTATATIIVQIAASLALSALSMMLAPKPEATGGIQTTYTMDGETTPQRFIMGYYATSGTFAAPRYSHTSSGGKDNNCLNYVIALSDSPVTEILPDVIIDGVEFKINGGTDQYGRSVDGDLSGKARFHLYDGNQTTADSMLTAKYWNHQYPWNTTAILKGTAYSVGSFFYDQKRYSGLPTVRHIVRGIPLYDPRYDSSVGGIGPQRWVDRSTWAFSDNPVVMVYNLLRGITMPDGSIYGVLVPGSALPLAAWTAAMNVCDEPGTQPESDDWRDDLRRYRAGYEVSLDKEPLSMIDEVLKACGGMLAEMGGTYFINVGPPGLPVASITDDDLVISEGIDSSMFEPLANCINTISATYPDPRNLWEQTNAEVYTKPEWVVEDQNLELVADLKLDACPFPAQVRRIMREAGADHRRRRTHTVTLPPRYNFLNIFDQISWTSPSRYYNAKVFEVQGITLHPDTLNVTVNLRERDPEDYDIDAISDNTIPTPIPVVVNRPTVEGFGFTLLATGIKDEFGINRRPAVQLAWNTDNDYETLIYEIVDSAGDLVKSGIISATGLGRVLVADGILPLSMYSARMKVQSETIESVWSDYQSVTTADIRLGPNDLNYEEITADVTNDLEELTTWIEDQNEALAQEITSVSGSIGGVTGEGLLKISVEEAPSGVLSRIGLKAKASSAEPDSQRSAAMFLEAKSGDTSQVVFEADRFVIVNGTARQQPFVLDSGNLYLGGDVRIGGVLSAATIDPSAPLSFDCGEGRRAPLSIFRAAWGGGSTSGSTVTVDLGMLYGPNSTATGADQYRLTRYGGAVVIEAIANHANTSTGNTRIQVSIDGGEYVTIIEFGPGTFGASRAFEYTTPSSFDTLQFRSVSTSAMRVTSINLKMTAINW